MIKLYRGDKFIQYIEPISAQLKKALMGPFLLELEITDLTNIVVGDLVKIEYNRETFTFKVRETTERKITAEHISYKLQNYVLVDKYINSPPTYDDELEFADITLDSVLNSIVRPLLNDVGFDVENQTTNTDMQDIQFSQDSLWSAIKKIAETWNVEFEVYDDKIIFKDTVGTEQNMSLHAGVHTQSLTRNVDISNVVTRVYPIGSSQNLPAGYYYTALRPTTFNMETRIHSGSLYVDNPTAQEEYGIIEKIVEFPDIKVESMKGTIDSTGTGYLEEYEMEFPYIEDSDLWNIDETRAKNCMMFISKGLNAAEVTVVHASAAERRIYYSPYLKDGTQLSWIPDAGSEYILLGYISQEEMDSARDKLIAAANEYLQQHAEPTVEYTTEDVYVPDVTLNVGDRITVQDSLYSFAASVRITELQFDFFKNIYKLTLSTKESIPYTVVREIIGLKQDVKRLKNEAKSTLRTVLYTPSVSPASGIETPSAPGGLQLSWGQDEIGVYIVATWAGVENAASYRVRYSYDQLLYTYLPDVTTTSAQFYVIPQNVVYVEVCSVGEDGLTSAYTAASIEIGGEIQTIAPQNVSAVGIFSSIQVTYDFPTDLLSMVDYFEIEVSTSSDFSNSHIFYCTGLVNSVDVPELLTGNSTTVYVRVRTISRTGTPSSWSAVKSTEIFKIKGEYIQEATIDSIHIKEGSIKEIHIGDATISNSKIKNLDASKITSGYINAKRIKAGTIDVEKLAAELVLQGKTIIAGDPANRCFSLNENGIVRRIQRGSKIFEREIGTILYTEAVKIPPSGTTLFTLPQPLVTGDVEVLLFPLSFPISRAGVDTTGASYNYVVIADPASGSQNQYKLSSYIVKDTERSTIYTKVLIPTTNWYGAYSAPAGGFSDRVRFYVQENYFPSQWTEHHFEHAYNTPGRYYVKIRWTGLSAGAYVEINWGDGNLTRKQIGSWLTTGIYAWMYAWNYSSNPVRYYTSGDVQILLLDRRG